GGGAARPRRRGRRSVRSLPLARRSAAAGSVHPHRRGSAHQQLPALGFRVHRAVLHRKLLARLQRRRPGGGDGLVSGAAAPFRATPVDARLLRTRVITSLILAPLVISAIYLLPLSGYAVFFWAIAAAGAYEWAGL